MKRLLFLLTLTFFCIPAFSQGREMLIADESPVDKVLDGFNLERMRKVEFTLEYGFLLMEPTTGNDAGTLHKINIHTSESETIDSIIDIARYQDDIVLLERRFSSVYVNFQNNRIPTTIRENVSFKQILDDGIAIVTNNEYNEIIDFIRSKNIYSYHETAGPVIPEEYNLIIEIINDIPNLARGREDDMIYYRVYLNGNEVGRTDTGMPGVKFEYTLSCDPDSYHIIKIERWKLDRSDNTYKRENNIVQPDQIRLYVPINRLMKIAMNYDGRNYAVRKFPVIE